MILHLNDQVCMSARVEVIRAQRPTAGRVTVRAAEIAPSAAVHSDPDLARAFKPEARDVAGVAGKPRDRLGRAGPRRLRARQFERPRAGVGAARVRLHDRPIAAHGIPGYDSAFKAWISQLIHSAGRHGRDHRRRPCRHDDLASERSGWY